MHRCWCDARGRLEDASVSVRTCARLQLWRTLAPQLRPLVPAPDGGYGLRRTEQSAMHQKSIPCAHPMLWLAPHCETLHRHRARLHSHSDNDCHHEQLCDCPYCSMILW